VKRRSNGRQADDGEENTMLANIMYVTTYVTDQDRALNFYTEQLGLEKRADNPGPEGRFLTVGVPDSPVEIVLWSHAPAAGQPAEAAEGVVPGPVFLETEDLRKDFEVLRDRGVTFAEPEPEDYTWGVRITAIDPDGNRIELRQRRRFPAA
jgi:catechol 2,3-dioxygenase-like lactoylglutathione lyase family enzyme